MEQRTNHERKTQNPEETVFFTIDKMHIENNLEYNVKTEEVAPDATPLPQKQETEPESTKKDYRWLCFISVFSGFLFFETIIDLFDNEFTFRSLLNNAVAAVVSAVIMTIIYVLFLRRETHRKDNTKYNTDDANRS